MSFAVFMDDSYVSVEPFHLFRYLDEQTFRFNNRKGTDFQRFFEVLSTVVGKRLDYRKLTAQTSDGGKARERRGENEKTGKAMNPTSWPSPNSDNGLICYPSHATNIHGRRLAICVPQEAR